MSPMDAAIPSAQRALWARTGPRHVPPEDRDTSMSETPASAASGDHENPLISVSLPPTSTTSTTTPRSNTSSSGGGAQLLRFFNRSTRRGGLAAIASPLDDDHESDDDTRAAEKHRMERVYREISGQTRRGKALARQGTSGAESDDSAWVDAEGTVTGHAPSVTSTLRFTRRIKKKKTKPLAPLGAGADGNGNEMNRSRDGDVTTEYLDAVLVKPTNEVFNKYTRFFLDRNLETLYQEYTAVNWFAWARAHMLMWMGVHALVALMYWIVPFSGFERMDLFLLDPHSVVMWCQYAYLLIALPFALLPSKLNPFQKHWRAWVCLIIILFNLTFQMWLASANRAAVDIVIDDVTDRYVCLPPNATEIVNSTTPPPSAEDLVATATEQKTVALSIVQLYADALVQVVAVFASAFSFVFIVSTRVEFVQCVIVGFSAVVTYVLVIVGYGMEFEWMTAVGYLFALILLLVLSRSSDLNNRRSFLSQLVVEKENESLQSYLTQAEAVLMNDAACDQEKHVVNTVLDNPDMKHLDMVRIPFSDIKLLQAIGRGAMGDVIKAKYFGTIVVCKRMRRENITEAAITSFREEIELMSSLRHPNIVQFIGATWDNCSNVCIVMEYLENGDMHSVLHSNLGRNFTWADPLLKMAIDAAQGMLYLHSQETPIVHRDLKSVNIFCSATFGCKVGDFGLSKKHVKGIDALTTLVGTPFWLAPEIIRNERYGPKADVFSFGIVLTELETRRTPYHDQEETGLKVLMRIAENNLRPSLPCTCLPTRRQLILDCLHDEPSKRPHFGEILRRLQGPVQQEVEESVLRPTTGSSSGHDRRGRDLPPHPHALGKRGSDQGLRGGGNNGDLQQPPPPKRDYFFDMINNVNNV